MMDHRLPVTGLEDTRAPELLGITWSFAALATILGAVRLYTRLRILRQKGWDDVLTFLALVRPSGPFLFCQ